MVSVMLVKTMEKGNIEKKKKRCLKEFSRSQNFKQK